MKTKKNIIIEQYNFLSSFLQKLTEKELQDLEKGNKELKFKLIDKNKVVSSKILSFNEYILQEIVEELNNSASREIGFELLKSKCSLKADYEAIAKKLDIPFTKKDSINKLKEKIIEGTIGFRLRSQAIQNKNE